MSSSRSRDGSALLATRTVRGVSLELSAGESLAVLGPSGCGKSTLLKHLIGLLRPAAGHVRYNGVDYWDSDAPTQSTLRAAFGVLFQSAALWSSMTILENVWQRLTEG